MNLPFISTCTGIGGLCAGLPNKIAADIWDAPAAIYRANHLGSQYYSGSQGNLYNFSLENINRDLKERGFTKLKRGEVGGYTSGSPCKDMSAVNPDRMAFGIRNFLMFEQIRIAKEFLPQWVIWEQVPGLEDRVMTPFRDMLLEIIERELGADYYISRMELCAMHYGAFQSRNRYIYMLVRKDQGKTPSYPEAKQVEDSQYLSSLIPGVVAYKNGKGGWQQADRVIGTMTSSGVQLKMEDGTIRNLTIEEKKLICGFGHMNFDVPGITNQQKSEILGNSVAYQFGSALMKHCLKEYQGIDI